MLKALLIVAIILSMITGFTLYKSNNSFPLVIAQTASPTPQNPDKLSQMDTLMGEHSILAGQLLIARYSNQPTYQAAKNAVNKNAQALADLVEDFYGTDAKDRFTTIWNRHLDSFIRYTDAKKNNDTNKQTQAIRELQTFTQDLANLLSRGNSEMFTIARNFLAQHVLNEKEVIDQYAARDFEGMYDAAHNAYIHASSLTDSLQ